jgi:hypothetical protein
MIERVVSKHAIDEDTAKCDLAYWLSRTPEERISAVEILRRQYYEGSPRLQRVARVIELESS